MTPDQKTLRERVAAEIIRAEFGYKPDAEIRIDPDCDDDASALKAADAILSLLTLADAQGVRRAVLEEAAKIADAEYDNDRDSASEYDGGAGSMGHQRASTRIAKSIRALQPAATGEL